MSERPDGWERLYCEEIIRQRDELAEALRESINGTHWLDEAWFAKVRALLARIDGGNQ